MGDFMIDHPFWGTTLIVFVLAIFVGALSCVRISTGEKQYTGYIYSAEDSFGETTGHIRFSQNAGEDMQPSFCVKKEHGDTIKRYAGTEEKVKVTIPAGFAIAWPWDCPIEATVEKM